MNCQIRNVGHELIIEGHHEEKEEHEGNFVTRYFKRRYIMPSNVDWSSIKSTINEEGTLLVDAVKKPHEQVQEREIAVQFTGSGNQQNGFKNGH